MSTVDRSLCEEVEEVQSEHQSDRSDNESIQSNANDSEGCTETNISEEIVRQVEYTFSMKKIPMSLNYKEKTEKPCPESFIPVEEDCYYCNVPLFLNHPTSGQVFMKHKKVNVKVYTKKCRNCIMTYRYQEYKDGFHNFNNFSFFSIRILEHVCAGYRAGTSLQETISHIQEEIDPDSNFSLSKGHRGNAVAHYMSLKELDQDNAVCFRCGYFPAILIMDGIRKIHTDLNPKDVLYDRDNDYLLFDDLYKDCCEVHLLKGKLPKKGLAKSDLENYGIKNFSSLPPGGGCNVH